MAGTAEGEEHGAHPFQRAELLLQARIAQKMFFHHIAA
jgi:hypothetical protein